MAAKQKKVIITCAATGSIHTPTMSPHLPLTPSEIAEQSIEAAEAGAAIIHLHARNPADGSPTPSPDVFMEFLPRIKQSCKSVINITTGGGHGMTLDERLAGAMRTKPEMSSLNMGSMNFGLFPMLDRYSEFKYEWERKHLENSRDFIFRNTFKDIEHILRRPRGGARHPLRVRVLRRRTPLQPRTLPRPGAGPAAAVRADHLRHPRRHRRGPGEPRAHEADRGQALRRRLLLERARGRASPARLRDHERDHGRQHPGRSGGQPVRGQGAAREVERGAGPDRALHRREPLAGGRDPRSRRARCSRSREATRSGSSLPRPPARWRRSRWMPAGCARRSAPG